MSNQPTRQANFGPGGEPPAPGRPASQPFRPPPAGPTSAPPTQMAPEHYNPRPDPYEPPVDSYEPVDDQYQTPPPSDDKNRPAPWYRKTALLIGWALLVLVLIALIVYGIGELIGDDENSTPGPATSSSNTTTPSSETTTSTASTTSTTATPSTSQTPQSSAAPAPAPSGTYRPSQQPTQQPSQSPSHHHHLPPLPSEITIPGGPTYTLPRDH